MKRILITGENSYIGTSFESWIKNQNKEWEIDTVDVRTSTWKDYSFTQYDIILNVAGIVHRNQKKTDPELYYKVNRDLAVELANKAKSEGVSQFIQMSTMAVFGVEGKIGEEVVIDNQTKCQPTSTYGQSKLDADHQLQQLQDDTFSVTIVRPPMVYGPNCVGNYVTLSKLVKKIRIFPEVQNKRSMIYVDNLSQILVEAIHSEQSSIIYPQNREYVSTLKMVEEIAETNNIKLYKSKFLGLLIVNLFNRISIFQKVLGNLVYCESMATTVNASDKEMEFLKTIKFIESK